MTDNFSFCLINFFKRQMFNIFLNVFKKLSMCGQIYRIVVGSLQLGQITIYYSKLTQNFLLDARTHVLWMAHHIA